MYALVPIEAARVKSQAALVDALMAHAAQVIGYARLVAGADYQQGIALARKMALPATLHADVLGWVDAYEKEHEHRLHIEEVEDVEIAEQDRAERERAFPWDAP
jgi:hypothetical protein